MKGEPTNSDRRACVDDLIAYHLHNYKQPDAHSQIATALESLQAPGLRAKLQNTGIGGTLPKKNAKALYRSR